MMTVDYFIPLGLPPEACRQIRQARHWLNPPAVGYSLGAFTCAERGIGLGDDLERCKQRRAGPCWYAPPEPSPPDQPGAPGCGG